MRLRKPTPSFVVAVAALMVSLGGTSYAVAQLGSADIRNDSLRSADIKNNSLKGKDIRDGSVRGKDLAPGAVKDGEDGKDGIGRWALIDADGAIVEQSGGFTVAAPYLTLEDTDPIGDNSLRAAGNVYINANEDLSNNGIVVSIALQNQVDQNADGIKGGRATGPDANPEFAGEISATLCGVASVVACAPPGTNNTSHLVVSPRNSDGTVTTDGTHKRFYVIITGDSTDYVVPAA